MLETYCNNIAYSNNIVMYQHFANALCSIDEFLYCTVDGSGEEEGDLFDYIAQPEGKIGAKKMAKLEEKARKRAEREVRGLLFTL